MADDYIDKGAGTAIKTGTISAAEGGVTYIIAIGIDKYGFEGINNFENKNCEKDCTGFINKMTDNYANFQPFKVGGEPDYLINEDATKEKIEKRIKDFLKSQYNQLNCNLIIYFSGHGDIVKINTTDSIGCLVPHGITSLDEYNLITADTLMGFFRRLNVRHFLYIADACKSGAIFHEAQQAGDSFANADTSGRGDRSRWAIVSSRANELSKAGPKDANSKFTEVLLKILEDNFELSVQALTEELRKAFINEEVQQQPIGGRLITDGGTNTGMFVLHSVEGRQEKIQRAAILNTKLCSFDYEDQRPVFRELRRKQKSTTIFYGTLTCGLWHLSNEARALFFKDLGKNFFKINASWLKDTGDMNILNAFLGNIPPQVQTMESLSTHFISLLKNVDVIIEIRFRFNVEKKELSLPRKIKKTVIAQFTAFIDLVNQKRNDQQKLFLFIVDDEDSDFYELDETRSIFGADTIFIPRTKALAIDKVEDWYDSMVSEANGRNDLDNFNRLFEKCIYTKLDQIYVQAEKYPGSFIREVCKEAGCINLADKILEPK